MSIDITAILNTLETGIIRLGKAQLSNYLPQVENDAKSITIALQGNIEIWTTQLKNGDITEDDLNFIIAGGKEYLSISALTQAGIAQIQLDQFKQSVINLIVNTLTSLVP